MRDMIKWNKELCGGFSHGLNNQPGDKICRTLHQMQCWEWRLNEEYKLCGLFTLSAYYDSHRLRLPNKRGSPSLLCMGCHHEGWIFRLQVLTVCFYFNLNKMNSKCLLAGSALSNMKTSMLEKTTLVEVWCKFRAILGDTENSRLYHLLVVLPGK